MAGENGEGVAEGAGGGVNGEAAGAGAAGGANGEVGGGVVGIGAGVGVGRATGGAGAGVGAGVVKGDGVAIGEVGIGFGTGVGAGVGRRWSDFGYCGDGGYCSGCRSWGCNRCRNGCWYRSWSCKQVRERVLVRLHSGKAGGGTGVTDAGLIVGVLAPPPINLIVGAVVSFTRTVLDTGSA